MKSKISNRLGSLLIDYWYYMSEIFPSLFISIVSKIYLILYSNYFFKSRLIYYPVNVLQEFIIPSIVLINSVKVKHPFLFLSINLKLISAFSLASPLLTLSK